MASLPSPELELAHLRARNAELEATLAAQTHRAVALEQAEAALRASETKYHDGAGRGLSSRRWADQCL